MRHSIGHSDRHDAVERSSPRAIRRVVVLLASPGDLGSEREVVRRVVQKLNKIWSRMFAVEFEIVGWEEVPSGFGTDGQDVINRYIHDDYDILLGLMGARLGSPTKRADSGTVEEYERALARRLVDPQSVELMFFFKQSVVMRELDPDQIRAVQEFQKRIRADGLLSVDFDDVSDLEEKLEEQLAQVMQSWSNREPPVTDMRA
jgi:hypothetical protein